MTRANRRRLAGVAQVVALLVAALCVWLARGAPPIPADNPPAVTLPRFMPACEINRLDLPQYYDAALPGIRAWAGVTDTILVITSRPTEYRGDLWQRLARDVPGVRFVPGIKLSGRPGTLTRIDDPAVWTELAAAVRESVAETVSAWVLLDCETGRYPWINGEYEVAKWLDVLQGMSLLPRDVTYLMYPPVGYGESDPRHARTEQFVRSFVSVHPSAWIVTFEYSQRATASQDYYRRVQALNETLAPGRCLDICYTYRDTGRVNDWQPAHLPRLLDECPRPVLIYGGWGSEAAWAEQQVAAVQLYRRATVAEDAAAALTEALATERSARAEIEQRLSAARNYVEAARAELAIELTGGRADAE